MKLILVLAAVAVVLGAFVLWRTKMTGSADLVARVVAYRSTGSASDGLHVLREHEIDALDYALMGADNSCARIKSGLDDPYKHSEGRWYRVSERWTDPPNFSNAHGISSDGGKTYRTESALMSVPRQEFQVSPEEVVWHYRRELALRTEGVSQDERVRLITADRAMQPWAKR